MPRSTTTRIVLGAQMRETEGEHRQMGTTIHTSIFVVSTPLLRAYPGTAVSTARAARFDPYVEWHLGRHHLCRLITGHVLGYSRSFTIFYQQSWALYLLDRRRLPPTPLPRPLNVRPFSFVVSPSAGTHVRNFPVLFAASQNKTGVLLKVLLSRRPAGCQGASLVS